MRPPPTILQNDETFYLSSEIHSEDPNYAAYHPKAEAGRPPGDVVIYNVTAHKVMLTLPMRFGCECIIFHRNARLLFVPRRYGNAILFDKDGKILAQFEGMSW